VFAIILKNSVILTKFFEESLIVVLYWVMFY